MSNPHSAEAVLEAQEALRKLSGDLATYRDPDVQRYLAKSSSATDRPLESTSSAELKAMIIALRTDLHDSKKIEERSKEAALQARKRAARAEGQIDELKRQLNEKEVVHDEIVKHASERIEALERESESIVQSANEKALVLQGTIDRDRFGHTGIIAEKDMFRTQAEEAKSKVAALERELGALEQRHKVETNMMARDKDAADSKIAALHKELLYLEKAISNRKAPTDEIQQTKELCGKLQKENAQLKLQVASQSKEALALKRKQIESQSSIRSDKAVAEVHEQDKKVISALREEVKVLWQYKRKSANTADHAAALAREKEELSRLIRNLSPTGDVQEGLQILKSKSFEDRSTPGLSFAGSNSVSGKHEEERARIVKKDQAELLRKEEMIEDFTRRARVAEEQLKHMRVQRDEALVANKRLERIRGISECQKTFLKQALDKIESDFDRPADLDDHAKRIQDRCDMYEKSCDKYESAVKALEKSLNESRKRVEKLAADFADVSVRNSMAENKVLDATKLRSALSEASKNAKEAFDARNIALHNTKKLEARTRELEAEVQRLVQLEDGKELDYDPAVAKVLHMKDNPFAQASANAAKENEIKAGKKRMRLEVQTSPGRGPSYDSRVAALRKEVEELETKNEELARKSKVGIRLGEVAKKKIEEVRAVVYNLFGWSMNVFGAKYRISSIYAEGPEEILEFGMNESGTMTLMETAYTSKMLEEIEQYVQRMNSIPALLANITIENFDKTTALV